MEYFLRGKKRQVEKVHYIIYERAYTRVDAQEKMDFSLKIKGENTKNVEN